MTRSAVLVNPARVRNAKSLRLEIAKALSSEGWPLPAWFETSAERSGTEQAREAVESGVGVLFVCGGDGTVRAAVEGLAGTETALAVLPSGTANVLALNLGIPPDLASAVRVATRGERRRIDVGDADGRVFTVAAGMGLDAQMLADTSHRAKHRLGWAAYAAAAARHLGGPRFPVQVRLDGGSLIPREVRSVLVVNVGRFPGGLNLLPAAEADDGYLDVVLIAPRRLVEWAGILVSLRGHPPRAGKLETFRARRVEIVADQPQGRQVDGDQLPPGTTMVVSIRPAALTACVPSADQVVARRRTRSEARDE